MESKFKIGDVVVIAVNKRSYEKLHGCIATVIDVVQRKDAPPGETEDLMPFLVIKLGATDVRVFPEYCFIKASKLHQALK